MKLYFLFCLIACMLFIVACEDNTLQPDLDRYVWITSTPQAEGFDREILDSAYIDAASKHYMDALLIVRHRSLVAEAYYNGYDLNSPHNVKSVSKSFLSVITGKALEQGYIDSLEEKVLGYFPEYISPEMDERKYDITIRHLLTMQMGIGAEADNNYLLYNQIYASENWIKTTLELPLLFSPGNGMRYNTFQTHLLSAIITKATGRSTLQYARETVFNPMGIDVDHWEKDPQGYYFGGNSMCFTPREMATLGQVYLDQGLLDGRRIVPAEWIALTLTRTRPQDVPAWGVLTDYNYGYLWWLGKINGYQLWMALGYGGQTVLVFPELDLIVVTTAHENIPPDVDQERPILELVARYVLPAVSD